MQCLAMCIAYMPALMVLNAPVYLSPFSNAHVPRPALTSQDHAPSYKSPFGYLHFPWPSLTPFDQVPSYLQHGSTPFPSFTYKN